jgi:hypothetical protein
VNKNGPCRDQKEADCLWPQQQPLVATSLCHIKLNQERKKRSRSLGKKCTLRRFTPHPHNVISYKIPIPKLKSSLNLILTLTRTHLLRITQLTLTLANPNPNPAPLNVNKSDVYLCPTYDLTLTPTTASPYLNTFIVSRKRESGTRITDLITWHPQYL